MENLKKMNEVGEGKMETKSSKVLQILCQLKTSEGIFRKDLRQKIIKFSERKHLQHKKQRDLEINKNRKIRLKRLKLNNSPELIFT